MLYGLPEELQWCIWKSYYGKFVLPELETECESRAATTLQVFVKTWIEEILADVTNVHH